jgi:hypothetical protein
MSTLFGGVRAPSTLGSHLRSYSWGNVSQLEKAGREFLIALAGQAPLLPGAGTLAFIDIDSMQKRVYGHKKQGAKFGHQDPGQIAAGPGPERAGRDHQHAAVGAGDRHHQAARRERRLRARRGQPGRTSHRHRAGVRVHGNDRGPAGLGVLQCRGDRRGPPGRRPVFRHRPDERIHPRRDRRHRRGRLDRHQIPARHLGRPAGRLDLRRRGRRGRVHGVRAEERARRSPPG